MGADNPHQRRLDKRRNRAGQVLQMTVEDGKSSRGRGGYRGYGRGRGRGRGMVNRETVECYHCHKLGHFKFECPDIKEAHFIEDTEDVLLMAYSELSALKENAWYMDSGCSNHMSGQRDLFTAFDDAFKHSVRLGDGSHMRVTGKGSVCLILGNIRYVISEVFYIPELKSNLISLGQLQSKGVSILIAENKCKIFHPEKGLILQSEMTANRLFVVTPQMNMVTAGAECNNVTAEIWHRRFAHLNYSGLALLKQKNMVRDFSYSPPSRMFCVDCIMGKHHRAAAPKESNWRASEILELVHSDLCGPITPISKSKKRYYILFIDDFSRKTWISFLSEKSQALESFQDFKTRVEIETGKRIRKLRTDRGGEFTSTNFNEFCKSESMQRQLTAPRTPHQNGVAERRNRTIMNKVRSLLHWSGMPKIFWPEAANWSVYVLNRSPTKSLVHVTPEEAWSGLKPTVQHLRTFGCMAYVHVSEENRSKLDYRSIPCIFMGMSTESKAYRLYNPSTDKIIISKDVMFEEDQKWDWNSPNSEIETALDFGDLMNLDEDNSDGEVNEEIIGENLGENPMEEADAVDPTLENIGEASTITSRVRSRPRYLEDYIIGDGLDNAISEDEAFISFSLSDEAHLSHVESPDPKTFEDAVPHDQWREAMRKEIESIERNNTWTLTTLPAGAKKIGLKWIFKTKYNEQGAIDKYKARLVAKGYSQEYGVDYEEIFAPVARMDTMRMIVALAAQQNWVLYQLDVKSAFLHGELTEVVYVEQPKGFEKDEVSVYKLHKALYGLKQAPRAWFSRLEKYFLKAGFIRDEGDLTLFIKRGTSGSQLIVSVYVDDLLFTGNSESMFQEFKASMLTEFDMTDLGEMRYFLGLEVLQCSEGIYLSQSKYVADTLEKYGMAHVKEVSTPIVPGSKINKDVCGPLVDPTMYKQMIGSLMYITTTRPDLMYSVALASRYMASPKESHLQLVKRIFRYLQGTRQYGLFYSRSDHLSINIFTDSDYAGDLDDRKSTSGYVYILNSGAISWSSKKQPIVTLSTTEAEFVAAASCVCQGLWTVRVLHELGFPYKDPIIIQCDNNSTIKLSKNPVLHGKSKHIDVRFHFLRNLVKEGRVRLVYCGTADQVADIMTKPLKAPTFMKLRALLGVQEVPMQNSKLNSS